MTSLSVSEWTSVLSTAFAAVAAVLSMVSIFLTRRASAEQRRLDQQRAAEERASAATRRYLELALQYPDLSTVKKSDRDDWFVSFVLVMVQDVLLAYKGDDDRKRLMKYQLGHFRDSLIAWERYDAKNHTHYLTGFGQDVEALVREVIREKAPA